MTLKDKEKIETNLLLDAIFHCYGYDFRSYAKPSLKRRIAHRMELSNIATIADLIPLVIHDKVFFNLFLKDMSLTVTEMFRDPSFFKSLRDEIIPILKTFPFVKIWHAGCATGEEVYSLAILLKEEGFYDKTRIYATDFNSNSIEIAKEGIYPIAKMKAFTNNYNHTGGKGSFSDYYEAKHSSVKFNDSLKKNITFAHHNLAQDRSFGEMNIIICRNVMMYFDGKLQSKVLSLFLDSLCNKGFLCIGMKESLIYSNLQNHFEPQNIDSKIYRKKASERIELKKHKSLN